MTTLGFVCILRDSGDAAYDLCGDIAGLARPGDEVILLDDSGPGVGFHTSAVVARFGAMEGWPAGVTVRHICTGVRGHGDEGTATALALAEVTAEVVVVLPGRARLDADGFNAARDLTAQVDLVVGAVMAPGTVPPDSASAQLGRLMFRKTLAQGLSCVQGGAGGGTLPLVVGVQRRAQAVVHAPGVIATLPPLAEVTPDWLAVWNVHAPLDAGLLVEQQTTAGVGARLVMAATLGHPVPRVDVPAVTGRAKIKVVCEGVHAHRMPLAYSNLADLWQDHAEVISDPKKADLILFAHLRDLGEMRSDVARAFDARPRTPVALLSEEPFWDTLFSPEPLARSIEGDAAHFGTLRLHQRNHHTSPVYDFDHIPYFLLTEDHYATRYGALFARNAALTADDWQQAFAGRQQRLAFMAERRPEPFHDLSYPAGQIVGLCAWRTRLAQAPYDGRVARFGASWGEQVPSRLVLEDWHASKIAQLDGTVAVLSGVENTHQPTYLSEKLFDAFACGARPLYMGGPAHRVHGLGLPEGAWVNLWGRSSAQAVTQVGNLTWDADFFADYAQAQARLAALWNDANILSAERLRLGRALVSDLVELADSDPP